MIFGCAMPEAEQGLNVARIAALRAGLPVSAPRSPSTASVHPDCRRLLRAPSGSWPASPRHRRRGRNRVDEPGPDGREQDRRRTLAGRQLPGCLSDHRARRRESRARTPSPARSRTRSRCAAINARSPQSTRAASRTRSSRVPPSVPLPDTRRGSAPRYVARSARQAAAGFPRRRARSRPATRRRRATAPRRCSSWQTAARAAPV